MASDPELTQAVQGFLSLMWQHVDATIRAMVHQHHQAHEPGGKDQVRIPVSFLVDVSAAAPDDGDTLLYNATDKLWLTGPGGTGGGSAGWEAVCSIFGELVSGSGSMAVTNLTLDAKPFNRVAATCEPAAPTGGITVTIAGHGVTISAGNTASSVATVSDTWASDGSISASITSLTGVYDGSVAAMIANRV